MAKIPILSKATNIAEYYNSLIDKHGATPKGVDASGEESLNARWKALSQVMDLTGKTILDVGCGWGYGYECLKDVEYTGIDISLKAIKTACHKYPFADFEVAGLADYKPIDVMTGKPKQYDVVLAQGIFYKLSVNNDGYAKVFELINHMVRLAKEAIAFTGVSIIPFGHSDTELRIEPHSMLNYLSTFSPFITMKTDYWLGDSCWYLYKEQQS